MTTLRTQSRRVSLVEAVVNTTFGFTIQVSAQWFLFVVMHVPITTGQFWFFSAMMTLLSVARGYVIRRLFNSEFWKRFKRGHNGRMDESLRSDTRSAHRQMAVADHD